MSSKPSRSEQVIASYRQHKLAHSALYRIQALIREFEKDDAFDRKVAVVGLIGIVVLVTIALAWLFSGNGIILG